jgi:hypothetical protein
MKPYLFLPFVREALEKSLRTTRLSMSMPQTVTS